MEEIQVKLLNKLESASKVVFMG
ncbi:hypothetical protein LCGC14_2383520, partial [marine sediment metagenome]